MTGGHRWPSAGILPSCPDYVTPLVLPSARDGTLRTSKRLIPYRSRPAITARRRASLSRRCLFTASEGSPFSAATGNPPGHR